MYDNCLTQSTREKLLVIAYKRAVANKDPCLLYLLRNKYITISHDYIFIENTSVKITYFLSLSDTEAFQFLRYSLMRMRTLTGINIGTMYD
jgi:septum formation topological specificity factor MinE